MKSDSHSIADPASPGPTDNDADAKRQQKLFDWALAVLKRIGIVGELLQAPTIEELRALTLDVKSAEVALAIRDALHPASGPREKHFEGCAKGTLERVLKINSMI